MNSGSKRRVRGVVRALKSRLRDELHRTSAFPAGGAKKKAGIIGEGLAALNSSPVQSALTGKTTVSYLMVQ